MTEAFKSFQRRLKGYLKISIKINTKTGLLIRMPVHAQAFRIGGADQSPMITTKKYVLNGKEVELEVPYIPGSSLKGRMRSLLEMAYNKKLYTNDNKIWQHVRSVSLMTNIQEFYDDVVKRCPIDDLFGWAAANYSQIKSHLEEKSKQGSGQKPEENVNEMLNKIFANLAPTRLLFDDFFPSEETVKRLEPRSVSDFLEEKSENRIDRITSAADPRTFLRVKPGIEFKGAITMLLFDIDNDFIKNYLDALMNGLKFVEDTYLGSSGSRGYGRVEFRDIVVDLYKITVSNGSTLSISFKPKIAEASNINDLLGKLDSIAQKVKKELFEEP